MNIFRQGLLVLSLGLSSCLVQANTSLDHFIGHLEKVTDMEAGFTQVTADPSGNVLQSLSGTLTVARPGKMR